MNRYIRPFDICLNQERFAGKIRAGEICVRVEGTVEYTLKGGGKEQRGRDTKILKGGASWVKEWMP